MGNLRLLFFLILIFSPFKTWSQNTGSADALLDHLTGKWVLEGVMARGYVKHDITAEWVLGHQYLQIKETSRGKQASGQPTYDAIVYLTFTIRLSVAG